MVKLFKPGNVPRSRGYRLGGLVVEMKRVGPDNESELIYWGADVGAEVIDDAYSRGEVTLYDILNNKNIPGASC